MVRSLIPVAFRLAILVLLAATTASAQIRVVDQFSYKMPDGTNVVSPHAEKDVQIAMANQELQQAIIVNAIHGITELQHLNTRYFFPIAALEQKLLTAQRYSDSAAATDIAQQIDKKWNALQAGKEVHRTLEDLYNGDQPALTKALYKYAQRLHQSVQDAQSLPSKINAYVKSNKSGLKLLEAAWKFQGAQYRPRMQCNDLISDSLRNIGFRTPSYPWCTTCTATGGWFRYGMGPAFREIHTGDNGITLRQLADEVWSNKIHLPIGAVIVANGVIVDGKVTLHGHAALYDGVAQVKSRHEIITYDANAFHGFIVSAFTGNYQQNDAANDQQDLGMINLVFGGHQVGEHVTWLQWNSKRRVKVYRFVGNLRMPEPKITMHNAINAQCKQNVQLATAMKASACSKSKLNRQCKIATARLNQTIRECSVVGNN